MDHQIKFPFHFNNTACQACRGKCCRVSGYVWISQEELEILALERKLDLTSFYNGYVRLVQSRLSLQERLINGEFICCFFDPIDCKCLIYHNRPEQCKTYPFWNQYKEKPQKLLDECPGVFFE